MNFEMADANVQQHVNEIKHQASQCRSHATNRSRRTRRSHPSPFGGPEGSSPRKTLRGRVGITLIEAGLHLLATDGQAAQRQALRPGGVTSPAGATAPSR
jgi:hypothetical protein